MFPTPEVRAPHDLCRPMGFQMLGATSVDQDWLEAEPCVIRRGRSVRHAKEYAALEESPGYMLPAASGGLICLLED